MKPTRDSSSRMGSSNSNLSHNQTPIKNDKNDVNNNINVNNNNNNNANSIIIDHQKIDSRRAPSNMSQYSISGKNKLSNKQMHVSTNIDSSKVTFTVITRTKELQIKCVVQKGKKFFTTYRFEDLPKAIQVTYKSMQQLFEDIKYIVEQNVPNRLSLDKNGKIIFTLETKKKGKPQYLPETFQMQQESDQKIIARLEDEVQQLKSQDAKKQQRIDVLEHRLQAIQKMLKSNSGKSSRNNKNLNNNENYNLPLSNMNTIETGMNDSIHNASMIMKEEESIIKRFKRTKSNDNLSEFTNKLAEGEQINDYDSNRLLKTTIRDYDVFVELQAEDSLGVEILSRKEAKIYKCHITPETIPKEVYSFVPTPKQLHQQIAYIIKNNLTNRLDVQNNNFIYKASINTKSQETLVDGVFQTEMINQDDLERIQGLVDLRTTAVEEKVREIQRKVDMLKQSLQSNDIILEMPINFMESKIIQTNAQFITLCKMFKQKIFKISLIYRASQNNFQIKKFHELCDGIPNTLTIIWTEFDKVIGGFTSQQWDKNGNGKSISDYAGHSFIFSLTNRHKFALQQNEHAIQTGVDDGPRFGNGADLVIKDKANENNNSYANICTSYSHPRYIYKNCESYKLFSGDEKTNRFGIKQWEVFEVFFEE